MPATVWAQPLASVVMEFLEHVYADEYWDYYTDARPGEMGHLHTCKHADAVSSFCCVLMSAEFQVLRFLTSFTTDTEDFLTFVAGFHCIVLAGPEHAMLARLASKSAVTWHCLLSARIKDVHHLPGFPHLLVWCLAMLVYIKSLCVSAKITHMDQDEHPYLAKSLAVHNFIFMRFLM